MVALEPLGGSSGQIKHVLNSILLLTQKGSKAHPIYQRCGADEENRQMKIHVHFETPLSDKALRLLLAHDNAVAASVSAKRMPAAT